ncbi:HIT domain-containing protein [Parvularcula dongshanensis]|uniref:Histidine triad (HIT) family protein n=1 Tax=Parvularcula dongshanensis TaxID=1173995 RepID=A0A840I3J1_9PROT|nr:histidine triad (HIT) family protein [Parvularcula dongshanensis]
MSLDHAYEDDNVFARIIHGEMPAAKVYEDEAVLCFMDAFPQSEGHVLIVPKDVKAVNLLDTPTQVLHRLIVRTQAVAGAVVDALSPNGVRIVQYNGEAAGQSVFHVHFHVIPVYRDRQEKPHGSSPAPMEELERIAGVIRERL